MIPEAHPTPLSYWIDLNTIDDYDELTSEEEFGGKLKQNMRINYSDAKHWTYIDNLSADFSARLALASSPGPIPDGTPSPLSHWVDLHPIENSIAGHLTHQRNLIPEEPPLPLSHWIDLHTIEDWANLTPEIAPEPTSMFLELHPLQRSSLPEESSSPTEITLHLYELQD